MSPAKEVLEQIVAVHSYQVPLMVIIILVTVGLGIKSGLYPFHTWIPDAYGYTTPSSSAVLSSLVSKGYIFLLIKIFYRVLDFDSIISSHMVNILFAFGVIGMIMGSVAAIKEQNIRRMTAYSSVAQIGYIYMGIGLGTTAGVVAHCFISFPWRHEVSAVYQYFRIDGSVRWTLRLPFTERCRTPQ